VDNCYGEFIENREPTAVGADLIAGSLIKILEALSPLVATLLVEDLVEAAACRLTAPGIGSSGGATFDQIGCCFRAVSRAPNGGEAMKGNHLTAYVFEQLVTQLILSRWHPVGM